MADNRHDFVSSSKLGKLAVLYVKESYEDSGCKTVLATPEEDINLGVDLWIVRSSGEREGVDVKLDQRCRMQIADLEPTNHVFVELLSNVKTGRRGWAYTSQATYLKYVIPGMGIYEIAFDWFRRVALPHWEGYETRDVFNKGMGNTTRGVRIPIEDFSQSMLFCEYLSISKWLRFVEERKYAI